MPVIEVRGERLLGGEISIQGSKNAVLPVMAASLLHRGIVVIKHVPIIQDVLSMLGLLETLGCVCRLEGHTLWIHAKDASPGVIPREETARMRSSVLLLGPLLARFHEAELGLPGGCLIGARPVDLHLAAFAGLGAKADLCGDVIRIRAEKLSGDDIVLPYPSVGATENLLMAACGAEGTTVLHGAAREPEITALCRFLAALGVRVEGAGTDRITVRGGDTLHDAEFVVPGDRIVAGTYLGAVLLAGGKVFLRGAPAGELAAVTDACRRMGARIVWSREGLLAERKEKLLPVELATAPYPGFPTDLQSVFLAAVTQAEGVSLITETVFEERFAAAKELRKLGAHIIISGRTAKVTGGPFSGGSRVTARDLRGGAALAAAGLAAPGLTVVEGYEFIRRGYEDICGDLAAAGAGIRLSGD